MDKNYRSAHTIHGKKSDQVCLLMTSLSPIIASPSPVQVKFVNIQIHMI